MENNTSEKRRTHVYYTMGTFVRAVPLTHHIQRITIGGEGLRPLIGNFQIADAIKL